MRTWYLVISAFLLFLSLSLTSGQVNADDAGTVTVVIIPAVPSVNITSPNGGENWVIGSTQAIAWSSISVTGRVKIELSRDDGVTWTTIVHSTSDDGNRDWRVTGPATNSARIKVTDIFNHEVFDISDADFTITTPQPSITVISPDGGESWKIGTNRRITWDSKNVTGRVKLELSRDGGVAWATIVVSTANDGGYTWRVTGPATTHTRIKVSSTSNPAVFDSSNTDFTIGQ